MSLSTTRTPFRDTLDLLSKHPAFFQGIEYSNAKTQRTHRFTLVLCNPRSGSTLLLRLMNMACMSLMIGDHHPSYYESILTIANEMSKDGIYGHPINLEKQKFFPDTYRGSSIRRDRYLLERMIPQLLGREHYSSYHKTTILGFGNQLVVPFVQMMRDLYEDSEYDFRVCFLTRNHDEIIRSFATSESPAQDTAKESPERIKALLEEQGRQFKETYELGDQLIDYQDLISDPMKTLLKFNPIYSPNAGAVERIMKEKIRE